jgi:chorismate-pyruvate lyase
MEFEDLPTPLRLCAGTDGSVTFLLEALTRKPVEVVTQYQNVVRADSKMAGLLGIEIGQEVNQRAVILKAGGITYAYACSLAPLDHMPPNIREDLMRADIPIGKILRNHRLETRRDVSRIEVLGASDFFGPKPVLSREYRIFFNGKILMWINEVFPIDERWNL